LKRSKNGLRCGQFSLTAAMTRVKLAASLEASLIWLSGGLGLVQALFKETLPSWFIAVHWSEQEEGSKGMVAMLGGMHWHFFQYFAGHWLGELTHHRHHQNSVQKVCT